MYFIFRDNVRARAKNNRWGTYFATLEAPEMITITYEVVELAVFLIVHSTCYYEGKNPEQLYPFYEAVCPNTKLENNFSLLS